VTALLVALLGALGLAEPAHAAPTTPVIFVHGFSGNATNWATAMTVFKAGGYSGNQLFAYEYNSYGDNRTNAAGLSTFVGNVLAQTGASKVDIVNHSMGGLVSLWYLKQLGGTAKVSHLASIAGANHGTNIAATCLIFTTCQQMFPGSSFINTLTSGDETPGDTSYATWYSSCDGVILPYTSTRLSGATNNLITCQTHNGFLTDNTVLTAVRTFLALSSAPTSSGR
jgi:triacylglycerol lipase